MTNTKELLAAFSIVLALTSAFYFLGPQEQISQILDKSGKNH